MLDADVTSIVAVAAAGVAALSLLLVLWLFAKLRRLSRALSGLAGRGDERTSFVVALERSVATNDSLRRDVSTLSADLSDALRHVAVVRYDAFEDMGGRLSFSAALLDDAGDGLVLTSINARSETRTYAKGVKGGASDHSLSPEEQDAVSAARSGPARGPHTRAAGTKERR